MCMQYQLLGKYTVYSWIKGIACMRKCACNKNVNDQAQLHNSVIINEEIKPLSCVKQHEDRKTNKEKTLNTLLHIINTLSIDKATACFSLFLVRIFSKSMRAGEKTHSMPENTSNRLGQTVYVEFI